MKKFDQEVRNSQSTAMFVDEIAVEMGLTRQQVDNIWRSALRKVRYQLKLKGMDSDYFFKDCK